MTWKSHWGDVKAAIAEEPRYAAVPRTERDVLFRAYRDELEVRYPLTVGHADQFGFAVMM